MTLILFTTLLGCNNFSNPNPDYCVLSNEEGVYICEKRLISYFNTTISLKLYYSETEIYSIDDIFTYFEDILLEYHQYFDKYNEYDNINNVYTINNSVAPVEIDDILMTAIKYALDNEDIITVEDKSLFNIALSPVLDVWHDARENTLCESSDGTGILYCPVPVDQIDGLDFNTDPDDILLDEENDTISFSKDNMSIDLGGFAKGYVAKIIADHLDDIGVTYLLNVGNSNIITGGFNPTREDGNYYIALTKPTTDSALISEYFISLKIPENIGVVTSGNYQRFFKGEDDNIVYHHIIDPNTNYPGGYCMSVTLIYQDSALADILSTAIYLLPLDEAMEFVNNFDGLEALWYKYDDTYVYSDGFEQFILNI